MSQTPVPPDDLDRLLTDYFTSRMRRPWPAAPGGLAAEPAVARRPAADPLARARLTLAASVALLVGTGWYLAGGASSPDRAAARPGPAKGPDPFADATATTPDALKGRDREKAAKTADPMQGFRMP